MCDGVLHCLLFLMFFWCPYMAINVNVQYNGGFLPDIILLTQCYLHRGTCLNAMKRFCICSLWSHLNVLTFSPITGGCSEGLGAFWFFFKKRRSPQNHKNCVGSYETIFGWQNKTKFVLLRIVGNGVSGASLTSKFLLIESVVNVMIRKLFIRHSLLRPTRTAKPIACGGSRVRT